MTEGLIPSEPFVDSKEKTYNSMLEILEYLVHLIKYPRQYDDDEIRGNLRQAEWCIERGKTFKKKEPYDVNSRLIASAPEMYEALKALLDEIPIIAGDSRHDALAEAIFEAQKLIESIDVEEAEA